MNESTEDLEELRRRLAQAEADRDASVRLLAATERALEVMADDYVRLAKSYGFVKGKPDERATYWQAVARHLHGVSGAIRSHRVRGDHRGGVSRAGEGGQVTDDMEQRLAQAERDRDVLAAEVEAWRDADDSHELLDAIDVCDVYGHRHAVENAQKEVDASGALTRAKEDK